MGNIQPSSRVAARARGESARERERERTSGILPGPESYVTCGEIDLLLYNMGVNPCPW